MHADEHRNELWQWVGPAVRRVRLRNFRCLAACDVTLMPLSVVVGRNGAGKSTFLDAIAFVGDAVRTSVREGTSRRGGLEAIRRRSTGHPRNLAFELEVRLPSWHLGRYGFELATRFDGGFEIRLERAEIRDDDDTVLGHFQRDAATVLRASIEAPPPPDPDQLYLSRAAAFAPFRELYDTLATMSSYDFDDRALRHGDGSDDGRVLAADGANLASVVGRISRERPRDLERIGAYLGAIAPGLVGVERVPSGSGETVQFRRAVAGAPHPWKFFAREVGAGTLRALATLLAAYQDTARLGRVSLAGLEGPERGLHPTALPVLAEAMRDAAQRTQLVLASHSPELIDALVPGRDALLVASARDGTSEIAEVDLSVPDEGEETVGDRLRRDALEPVRTPPVREDQLDLFGG